jgi:hypothetical protein
MSSFLPPPTTRELVAAEERRRSARGAHEPADIGLFSDDRNPLDIVDLSRSKPVHTPDPDGFLAHRVTFPLPPDPDGRNDVRADRALAAVRCFQRETGSDDEDAISDLLADLMHLCDRCALPWPEQLARAQSHYCEETSEDICEAIHREKA